MTISWQPDVLGDGFEHITLTLHDDDEGAVTATLVRHRPTEDRRALAGTPTTPRFVFLAVHGWNDYFYQVELAREVSRAGGAFYGLDLRKYGRSLMEHQTSGFIESLSDYDEDIHEALDAIHEVHGYGLPLVMYGHSTGGLTAVLWAHRHPGALSGLILNSPWLEFQGATLVRQISQPVMASLAALSPTAALPLPEDPGNYQRLLTAYRDENEEPAAEDDDDPFSTTGWEFNDQWRRNPSSPIRAGWLNAIMKGHKEVAKGLDVSCPILVLTSNRTLFAEAWSPDMRTADIVLDVEQIWRRVPSLGNITTLCRIDDAIHDVILSNKNVRARAFGEIRRWLGAYVPRTR